MSASRGRLQSISTTCTATSWALLTRAAWHARRTIRASLEPTLTARTARRKSGCWTSGTAVTIPPPPAHAQTGLRGSVLGVGVRRRRWVEPALFLAAIGRADDDRVGSPDENRPESFGGLVVEDPLPPVPGDVFGHDHEGDRLGLVRGPGPIEHVEVGQEWSDQGSIR